MSSPTSTKLAPPTYIDGRVRRRYFIVFMLQMWLSLIPASFLAYWFFLPAEETFAFRGLISQWWEMPEWVFIILVPLMIALIYVVTVIWTAVLTKLHLSFLNAMHKPIEGVFMRDMRDKDYVYWNRRNYARLFLNWLLYTPPFTAMKTYFAYRFLGAKIGENSDINHCWVSQEFVSIGKDVKIGQSAAVHSFMYENDKLLVAQIEIRDGALLGPQCVVFPGTVIGENSELGGGTWNHPFSIYEDNCVYNGLPAVLVKKKE